MEKQKSRSAKRVSSVKDKVVEAVKRAVAPVKKVVAPEKKPVAVKPGVSEDELFRRIQDKAYEVYVSRGCNHGRDLENWYEAERLVRAELGI